MTPGKLYQMTTKTPFTPKLVITEQRVGDTLNIDMLKATQTFVCLSEVSLVGYEPGDAACRATFRAFMVDTGKVVTIRVDSPVRASPSSSPTTLDDFIRRNVQEQFFEEVTAP